MTVRIHAAMGRRDTAAEQTLGGKKPGKWMRTGMAMALAGVMLGTAACDDDDKPDNPDDGKITDVAQRGLDISPFQIDVNGLSTADKEKLGVGSYLVNAASGCGDCHNTMAPDGTSKYLAGGTPFPIGPGNVVYARNLTPDADSGMKLTEAEFIESMRTGRDYLSDNDEETLIVMPWQAYRWMSTEDLKSIYAYLQKIPAIRNKVPDDIKGPAAAARPVPFTGSYTEGAVTRALPDEGTKDPLYSSRGLAIQPLADPSGLANLSADDKAKFGRGSYLVNAVGGCNDCHTNPPRGADGKVTTAQFMTGGTIIPLPPEALPVLGLARVMSSNLVGANYGAARKGYEPFRKAITQAEVTMGTTTRPMAPPMAGLAKNYLSKMLESDIQSLHTYLANHTAATGAADKETQPPARYCTSNANCTGAGETCNTATNECVGGSCSKNSDCGACQTCSQSVCVAPDASSTCTTRGI